MLQIKGIKKVYKTGSLIQAALKGVSLSLRDNEFVAILGQSGSGKTTLLNIIGGLDRYDDGDLIINGISTKQYSDRDWDSYRNHTVGFVFQSYNLIPHQTVLKNVELALTISGISAGDRTARATEALEKVGLSEHIHKKPSQLSGGQMQRVAIARALVNDPDILLADEPTGALDSDTSIQVMDLLKEVAQDRLVVMVTHNPELAEQYATRIVTLKDGEITSDSDPYTPAETEAVHKNLGKSSMSLLTSMALSFNNLWTKKARTILVAFAGSIGIIGIAMILAMSNGANEYIRSVEEGSLQDYPLQITDTSFSMVSMFAGGMSPSAKATEATPDEKVVEEWRTVTNIISGMNTNDLKSLKAYFQSDECDINDHVQTIEYDYNITPRIYKENDDGSFRQVNPSTTFAPLGFGGSESSTNGLFSAFSNTNSFFVMPEKDEVYQKSFDLKAGKWPENHNECIVTLTANGRVSDLVLYIMGLKDPKELTKMIDAFSQGESVNDISELGHYSYDDFLGTEFKIASVADFYTYDKDYSVWTDHSTDTKYLKKLLDQSESLKVVGVAQLVDNTTTTGNMIGIGYHSSLTNHVIELAAQSDIVKAQLKDPDTDVFTGKSFDDDSTEKNMDMSSLFSVDSDALGKAFSFDSNGMDLSKMDLSDLDLSSMDLSDMDMSSVFSADDLSKMMPQLSEKDIAELLSGIKLNVTAEQMNDLFSKLLSGYQEYAKDDQRADISSLPSALRQYLNTDEAKDLLRQQLTDYVNRHSDDIIKEEDIAPIAESYIDGYASWLEKHSFEKDDYSHINDYVQSEDAKKILQDGAETLREKLRSLSPTDEELNSLAAAVVAGYEAYADKNALPSASYLLSSFTEYLSTDKASSMITSLVGEAVDASGLEKSMSKYSDVISSQLGNVMAGIMNAVSGQITSALQAGMSSLTSSLSSDLLSAFDFDPNAFADLFKTKMSAEELKDLMVSLFNTTKTTFDGNLKKLGYADLSKPSTITIYPKDFDSKTHIKQLISDYNARMKAAGEDDKVIEYTDLVDALMGSVTTIIDAISYVLIAFVAISLIVSSIMIGVITYISVLERKKEIGILRAIGASKRNISQVFNAETFIIGALAGVIGIGVTELLIIPANLILHALTEQENINAILPPAAAGILILLSIVLTLIGGIIPSRKAAKSDPVTALRSE